MSGSEPLALLGMAARLYQLGGGGRVWQTAVVTKKYFRIQHDFVNGIF